MIEISYRIGEINNVLVFVRVTPSQIKFVPAILIIGVNLESFRKINVNLFCIWGSRPLFIPATIYVPKSLLDLPKHLWGTQQKYKEHKKKGGGVAAGCRSERFSTNPDQPLNPELRICRSKPYSRYFFKNKYK